MPERIPYDVVYLILTKALHTPLLPHPDYDLFECETMFSSQCCSDMLRRESERLARTLRLVCREWDELVPKLQPRLMACENRTLRADGAPTSVPPHVLYRPGPSTLSGAHRLELGLYVCRRRRHNKCPDPSSCRYFNWALIQASSLNSVTFPAFPYFTLAPSMEQLQILIPGNAQYDGTNKEMLDRMPSLKAISSFEGGKIIFFTDLVHHPVHAQLTHLKIFVIWDQFTQLVDPIDFPDLRYLDLRILENRKDQPPPSSAEKMKWAILPRLHTLQLSARFSTITSEYLYSFLAACGSTVSSLVLDAVSTCGVPRRVSLPITPRLYNLFPRLTAFGPKLSSLYLNPPPPPRSQPPMVLVVQPLIHDFPRLSITVDACIASFVQACHDWGKNEIRFLDTWQEMATVVQYTDEFPFYDSSFYIPFHLKFYDRLEQSRVIIRDRAGSLITSPQGEAFIRALRKRRAECLV